MEYRALWPAHYLNAEPERGACYVPAPALGACLDHHARKGQWWKFRGELTSYCPNRYKVYKAIERLDVKDESEFWQTMEECERAGLKPPSSAADIFAQFVYLKRPIWSLVAPFVGRLVGGWQKAFEFGEIHGPIYHYDINSAYRWAAERGLWNLGNAEATRDWSRKRALFLVRGVAGDYRPYPGGGDIQVVSSEERDALCLSEPKNILFGIAFPEGEDIDLSSFFAQIDRHFPTQAKHISRSFWGAWISSEPVQQCSLDKETGEIKRRDMPPRFPNPIYAHLVLSRVKIQLAQAMRDVKRNGGRTVRVHVDAICATAPLPPSLIGKERGQFRKVATYQNGLIIFSSGVAVLRQSDGSASWLWHSGISTPGGEMFFRSLLIRPPPASADDAEVQAFLARVTPSGERFTERRNRLWSPDASESVRGANAILPAV